MEHFLSFINNNIFLYSWKRNFFKIPKHLIASVFLLRSQILKNVDMPQQKPQHLPIAEANFECCKVQFAFVLFSCIRYSSFLIFPQFSLIRNSPLLYFLHEKTQKKVNVWDLADIFPNTMRINKWLTTCKKLI